MTLKVIRKPFKIGTSRALILPTHWCNYYAGRIDKVTIIEDGVLVVAPRGLEERAQRMIEQVENNRNNKGGIQDG